MINFNKDQINDFISNITQCHDIHTCWIWHGYNDGRYGRFSINRRYYLAHRAMYELMYEEINNSLLYVCHKCDVTLCVNPFHLYLGTHKDNVKDMVDRLRYTKGSDSHLSILTDEEVIEILDRIQNKEFGYITEILEEYPVTRHAIQHILRRESWKHITNKYTDLELYNMRKSIHKRIK